MNTSQCEKINELISGYIDNELTQQQRQLVSVHLDSCTSCHTTFNELKDLQDQIANIKYPELEEDSIKELLNEPVSKKLSIIGWIVLLCGAIGLVLWHSINLWTDSTISAPLKILISLVHIGLIILFASVLRQRMIARKTDRYKDIQI